MLHRTDVRQLESKYSVSVITSYNTYVHFSANLLQNVASIHSHSESFWRLVSSSDRISEHTI